MQFGTVLTAMVTPFDSQGGLDKEALPRLIEHLFATGTEGIIISGTTGESPTLTDEERMEMVSIAVSQFKGKGQVIVGTGTNDTEKSVQLSKEAQRRGADGLLVVVPYYNKPSQEGMYRHFARIAQEVDLPIMLYNIPGRSGVNLEPQTVARLAAIDNIVAIKESSGDLTQMAQILELTQGEMALYSGDDKLTLPVLSIGGVGVVSVAAHVVGEGMQEMIHAYRAGQVDQAARLHRKMLDLFEALFVTNSPAPLKFLLNRMGIPVGGVRLPLAELPEDLEPVVWNAYQKAIGEV